MSQHIQFSLLTQRRFAPFFWTQFLGAFNDNVFKIALITILTYDAIHWTNLDVGMLNQLIPGLFILPFLLLSATSGQLADKFEKAGMARNIKLLEIVIMIIAATGWMTHQLWLLITAVAGMGIHSTLFGPVKYAYLPQHLRKDELVGGNGVVEAGTFVGILLGEILGAVLVVHKPWGIELVAGITITIAILGWIASLRIPYSAPSEPELKITWNIFSETFRNISFSKQNRPVFLSLLGNSWFWFYGAIVLANMPLYAKDYLHGDHSVFVLLLTVFSFGIGAGSLLCERLSGHKIEIGLVPFGSIGLSVFGFDLYLASLSYTNTVVVDMMGFMSQTGALRVLFDMIMIGIFGGLFVVPLFAVIQTRCDPKHLSRTIAGMNIMNALFMVVASLCGMLMLQSGFTIPQIFMATAILNAIVAMYIFSLVPEFLMRFIAWLLIHTVHSVKGVNTESLPEEGAAILVCNHVSYMDAIVIMAYSPRPIRFVMDHRIFKIPFLSWIFRTAKAIPIAPAKEDPWTRENAHKFAFVQCFCDIDVRFFHGPRVFFSRGPFSKLELVVGKSLQPSEVSPLVLQEKVKALRGDWK